MNKITAITLIASILIAIPASQVALADNQEKLDFAAGLEETLGHFWALEKNLDEGNAKLALVHATHPIAELYDVMKPVLQKSSPELDKQVQTTLLDLGKQATTTVSRTQAQQAIDDAKQVVQLARETIVGESLSNDRDFKLQLMKTLLETSIVEYHEAVSDGIIKEMAEFQDGSAFVWRSQQIFDEIKSDIGEHEAEEIEEFYEDLWNAYEQRSDSSVVETLAGGIIHEVDEVLGIEGEEDELLEYVETIESLLEQTKSEYAKGNTDLALSLTTKAYLDNFEFLEGPLVEMNEEELMEEVEQMLRVELRDLIKNGAPSSEVNAKVDAILVKMDSVAMIVPEFGTITTMILVIAIISIIAITARSRTSLITRI